MAVTWQSQHGKNSFYALCNTGRDSFILYFTQCNWVTLLYSLSTTIPTGVQPQPELCLGTQPVLTKSWSIKPGRIQTIRKIPWARQSLPNSQISKPEHLACPDAKQSCPQRHALNIFTPRSLRLLKSLPGQYLKKQGTLILCLRTRWPKPVRQWTCFGSWHKITEGQWLLQYICYFIMRFCGQQSICALTLEHNRQRFWIRRAQIS